MMVKNNIVIHICAWKLRVYWETFVRDGFWLFEIDARARRRRGTIYVYIVTQWKTTLAVSQLRSRAESTPGNYLVIIS